MVQQIITAGYEYCVPKEAQAGGVITPGAFIEYDGAGNEVSAAAAGATVPRIAYNHGDVGQDPDTDYDPEGDEGHTRVKFVVAPRGVEVSAPLASGTVSTGDELEVNATGYLIPQDTNDAVAVVALDNEGNDQVVEATGDYSRVTVELI